MHILSILLIVFSVTSYAANPKKECLSKVAAHVPEARDLLEQVELRYDLASEDSTYEAVLVRDVNKPRKKSDAKALQTIARLELSEQPDAVLPDLMAAYSALLEARGIAHVLMKAEGGNPFIVLYPEGTHAISRYAGKMYYAYKALTLFLPEGIPNTTLDISTSIIAIHLNVAKTGNLDGPSTFIERYFTIVNNPVKLSTDGKYSSGSKAPPWPEFNGRLISVGGRDQWVVNGKAWLEQTNPNAQMISAVVARLSQLQEGQGIWWIPTPEGVILSKGVALENASQAADEINEESGGKFGGGIFYYRSDNPIPANSPLQNAVAVTEGNHFFVTDNPTIRLQISPVLYQGREPLRLIERSGGLN